MPTKGEERRPMRDRAALVVAVGDGVTDELRRLMGVPALAEKGR